MDIERTMELLNQIINHVFVARNTTEGINELIDMGFEEDELEKYFNFSESDIREALEDNDDYEY